MKNSPILGVFLGVIVVLLIIIFSLGYQLNKTHSFSSGETARRIKAEESVDKLIREVESLKEEVMELQVNLVEQQELVNLKEQYVKELEGELEKVERLKDKLEENLKEELVDPGAR
jgi:peptidoglycan hydrolase CwlO-like protein